MLQRELNPSGESLGEEIGVVLALAVIVREVIACLKYWKDSSLPIPLLSDFVLF
jgi:hypothetical protein